MPTRAPCKLLLLQDRLQLARRIRAFAVVPEPDVLDGGRAPRLLQIGPAGQQRDRVGAGRQHGALEEDEAAGVEAGEVIEALLREQQDGVELLAPQRWARARRRVQLAALEMKDHLLLPLFPTRIARLAQDQFHPGGTAMTKGMQLLGSAPRRHCN